MQPTSFREVNGRHPDSSTLIFAMIVGLDRLTPEFADLLATVPIETNVYEEVTIRGVGIKTLSRLV